MPITTICNSPKFPTFEQPDVQGMVIYEKFWPLFLSRQGSLILVKKKRYCMNYVSHRPQFFQTFDILIA